MAENSKEQKTRRAHPSITVVAGVLGSILALAGSVAGTLWLAILYKVPVSVDPKFIQSHAGLQTFGFLIVFIMGVSYVVLPRFKNKVLPYPEAAYTSVILVAIGNAMTFLPSAALGGRVGTTASAILILMSALLFTFITLRTLGRPAGPLAVAEPYMSLSAVSLLLSSSVKLASDLMLLGPMYVYTNSLFVQLSLIGFPVMMIFGVEVRTVHFRIVTLRRGLVKAAFWSAAGGVLWSFMVVVGGGGVQMGVASSVLFAASGLLFVASVNGLGDEASRDQMVRMSERDRVRYLYFSPAVRIAFCWLLLGLVLLIPASWEVWGSGTLGLKDAAIHSIAVGFIGTTIMAYGAILLPPLISGKVPYRGLTLAPVYIVTLGNVLRVGGSLLTSLGISFWPTWLSGVLILVGMAYFLRMVHSLHE